MSSSQKPSACKVVVNHEEQYSIWPADRTLPAGWRETGTQGSQEECAAFVEAVRAGKLPQGDGKR